MKKFFKQINDSISDNIDPCIWTLVSGVIALLLLRATTPFSYKEGGLFLGLAFLSVVPVGLMLTDLLAPALQSPSERWALVGILGYAASVLIGYFVGLIGLPQLYLPLCLIFLLVSLGKLLYRFKSEFWPIRKIYIWASAARFRLSRPAWIVASLIMLGIAVSTPLMSPVRQVTSWLYYDYAYIDNYFHVARAQIYMQGAPAYTLADMAGAQPYVYPDFHNFWLGQLALWSQIDISKVYFLYTPLLMITLYTLLMYAVGKALTGATWGGYIGALLPYVFVIPNFCNSTLSQNNSAACSILSASLAHFLDLRANLSYGIGGMLVAAIVLTMHLAKQSRFGRRTQIGLSIMSGVFVVFLLRIRPHFFVALAPWFAIFLLRQLWRNRDILYSTPILTTSLLFMAMYFESTRSYYDTTTTKLALNYGLMSGKAQQILPGIFQNLLKGLPSFVQPIATSVVFSAVALVGVGFSLILVGYAARLLFKKRRLSEIEVFLCLAWLTAILTSTMVVLESRQTKYGGDWGFQMLNLIPMLAGILVITPVYYWVERLVVHFPIFKDRRWLFGPVAFAILAVITYQKADFSLHNQIHRAYPITASALEAHHWIMTQTSELAVIAADPDYQVNSNGETIENTNFLSGQTRRPAYLQRISGISDLVEIEHRRNLLDKIFESKDFSEVRSALSESTFDYLLVYPDTTPQTDLSCCMTLVYDLGVKIYHNDTKPK